MNIEYRYEKDRSVTFIQRLSNDVQINGFIRDREKIQELISSGEEITPYVEPVKTLADIRAERDSLLVQDVDIYNPIRWAELSAGQKAKVKTYRQELLDITKQDPASVVWPELPLV